MGAQQAGRRRAIEAALLEFHRAPGRHTLARREPALLFASIREVLQLAGSRDDTARAARFFMRSAMLQPGADHYTLLGLPHDAEAAAIKDRYRALMRLVHPDFAKSRDDDWPADAATRINQAYEVLSSADKRRSYDEARASAPGRPDASARREADAVKPPAPRARGIGEPRRVLSRLAAGFGALGVIALGGLWAATAQNDRDSLVQRATTRIASGPLPVGGDVPADAPSVQANAAPIEAAAAAPLAPTPAAAPVSAPAHALPVALASTLAAQLDATTVDPAGQPAPPAAAAPSGPARAPAQASEPPASIPAQPAPAALTMATVQPVLTRLLQDIQSGWGDSLIAGLDRELRRTPGAQALARQLDALCDGARPVKIARIDLRGEPQGGSFVVSGQIVLDVRDPAAPTRQLPLQAEFIERDGAPVLTRIAPAS